MSRGPLLRGGETEMIERYSRPRMKRVWSDESKYGKWLLIELAACEAWAEEGVIPPATPASATPDVAVDTPAADGEEDSGKGE